MQVRGPGLALPSSDAGTFLGVGVGWLVEAESLVVAPLMPSKPSLDDPEDTPQIILDDGGHSFRISE